MVNTVYQYHVYNDHINLIVSVPVKTDEYAIGFAQRIAHDFYDYEESHFENIKCEFIVQFWMESAINLNRLTNSQR